MSETKDFTKRNLEQIENVLAERDRLRAVNAKLLEALRRLLPGPCDEDTCEHSDPEKCSARFAEAAIAAAEEE